MKRSHLLILGTVVIATAFLGCATGRSPERSVADRVCIRASTVEDFDPLDDRHLLVTVGVTDEYLFTLEPCMGLTFAQGIVLAETMDRVCSDGTSWLMFRQPGTGSKRCRIVDIEPVADEDAARALVEARAE